MGPSISDEQDLTEPVPAARPDEALRPDDDRQLEDESRPDDTRCAACGGPLGVPFFCADAVPVADCRMFATATDAITARPGRLDIRRCQRCGFAQNIAFDPTRVEYGEGYEDTQAHSPRFVAYAEETIRRQVERYGLSGATTLEIGCGQADWLRMTCRITGGRGIGIDPALSPGALDDDGLDLELLDRAYAAGDADLTGDLVVCRHTLEHIHDVAEFLTMMRANMVHRPDTILFLEVPDSARILREGAFWDLFYEHCSYFDEQSLADLACRVGFEVLDTRLDYDGQYVVLEARVGLGPARPNLVTAPDIEATSRFESVAAKWISEIEATFTAAAVDGRRVAFWGAGSKAVGLFTLVRPARQAPYVVDINPRKWGRFLPGTGHPVVSPEDAAANPVDEIIVLNPIYVDEVRGDLERMGVDATVTTVV